jgi:spermidine/putrescine transport system substrate-binding protein
MESKTMNNFFCIVALLLGFMGSDPLAAENEEKILNVYVWSEYVPDHIIQQFERETGIRINHSTYLNNESLYAKLEGNPEAPYDIIMPSSYFINRMRTHGLIQPIDLRKITNKRHLNPLLLGREHDPDNQYSLPYLWHSTGIVLNTRYHTPGSIKSWSDLWKPSYKGQLFLLDDAREIFSMALLTLGESVNTQKTEMIEHAYQTLRRLVPNVRLFNADGQQTIYLDEDITVGMAWSAEIYRAHLENPHLSWVYPREGFIISLDTIAIPKGAKHIENAHTFINFICRPDIAKELSLFTGFSSPNIGALSLMPDEVRHNPILYPDQDMMQKGFLLMDVDKSVAIYEKYYELLKLE